MAKEMVIYQFIYESLLTQICSGYYKKGDYLPPFEYLCKQYNTSVITVRKATQLLTDHGYLRYLNNKHYCVIYDADEETIKKYYIDTWRAKHNSVYELFDVLTLLMPKFFCQAIIRCDDQQIQALLSAVDEMDLWNHSLQEITKMRISFYRKELGTLGNELLADLYQQSINFIYIPFVPAYMAGTDHFFEYEYLHVQQQLYSLTELITAGKYQEVLENMREKYLLSREKTNRYIMELTKNHPDQNIAEVDFYWYASTDNSSLVSEIAMQIIVDRCSSGSLPSISKLAEKYKVSKQTVTKAIDALQNMGLAYTNSDYEVQFATDENIGFNFSIEDKYVRNGLMTYLSALQILVIILKDIAKESFSHFTENDIALLEKEFCTGVQSPQKILHWIIQKLPNKTEKRICAQLLKLTIHGHYLNYPTQSAHRQALSKIIVEDSYKIINALKASDIVGFSHGIQNVYQLVFQCSKKKMIGLGIDEAKKSKNRI